MYSGMRSHDETWQSMIYMIGSDSEATDTVSICPLKQNHRRNVGKEASGTQLDLEGRSSAAAQKAAHVPLRLPCTLTFLGAPIYREIPKRRDQGPIQPCSRTGRFVIKLVDTVRGREYQPRQKHRRRPT